MAETTTCTACSAVLRSRKVLWEYKGSQLWLCEPCASRPFSDRHAALRSIIAQIDQKKKQQAITQIRYRDDIQADHLESLLLHAFIDLIQERKAAGRKELVATMESIAAWLSDRTTLPVKAQHIQHLTLALRDGLIISVGGSGIGRPNSYDTREREMGTDSFWDQVDAFLLVYRLPNRMLLLQKAAGSANPL